MKYNYENLIEFLSESNAIEGVHDPDSLQQALHAWKFLIESDRLTVGTILKVHKILMLHSCLKPNEKGYFREVPVWVGGREGMEWSKIREAIDHWVMNANDLINNGKKQNPIFLEDVIKKQHVEYEKIHPFVDGNGRTGRMFMNWTRMKLGLPILIIHRGQEQQEYYKWFK